MEKVEQLIRELIGELGEDSAREGLLDTPKRVAKSYGNIFGGYGVDLEEVVTIFDGEDYDEMIICKDIDFYSTCEHHMQPFFGKAAIGYIPKRKIIGLSKLPRLMEVFSRRLQNQERLTMQVAKSLMGLIDPKGVGIVVEGKHFCMMARGVEKQNSCMVTSHFTGLFKSDSRTRSEFLKLIG